MLRAIMRLYKDAMDCGMGAWGFGILESDDALDAQYSLDGVAGVSRHAGPRARLSALREKLESALPELFAEAERMGETGQPDYDRAVGHQVLASTLMEAGCRFDEGTRQRLLTAMLDCDEYIEARAILGNPTAEATAEPRMLERYRGRVQAMEALALQLQGYDACAGVPSFTPSKGLMDVFEEKLTNGGNERLNMTDRSF